MVFYQKSQSVIWLYIIVIYKKSVPKVMRKGKKKHRKKERLEKKVKFSYKMYKYLD